MIKSYDFEGKNPWEPKMEFNQGIGLIDPNNGNAAVSIKPTEKGGTITVCSDSKPTTLTINSRKIMFFEYQNVLIGFGTEEDLLKNPTPEEISSCQRVNIQDLISRSILPSHQTPEI
jgi:hypothetical protein